jgi:hypothetical protein
MGLAAMDFEEETLEDVELIPVVLSLRGVLLRVPPQPLTVYHKNVGFDAAMTLHFTAV